MFWKKKKKDSLKELQEEIKVEPLDDKSYSFDTVKIEIPMKDVEIPNDDKNFPTMEMLQRVKPAVYTKGFAKLDIDPTVFREEQRIYNESLKPTHDVFLIDGWIQEDKVEMKAYRYSNVHSSIKKEKEIYDFGFDGSTLFNFIYVEEFNCLLDGDGYYRIYCTEEDLPYAKKFMRNHLLKILHMELTRFQLMIEQLKDI